MLLLNRSVLNKQLKVAWIWHICNSKIFQRIPKKLFFLMIEVGWWFNEVWCFFKYECMNMTLVFVRSISLISLLTFAWPRNTYSFSMDCDTLYKFASINGAAVVWIQKLSIITEADFQPLVNGESLLIKMKCFFIKTFI